jgi:hypothetical protein
VLGGPYSSKQPVIQAIKAPTVLLFLGSNMQNMSAKLKFDNYGSSVFGSRDRGLSCKPVLKYSRPLSDKHFQNPAVQKGRFNKEALRIPCAIC